MVYVPDARQIVLRQKFRGRLPSASTDDAPDSARRYLSLAGANFLLTQGLGLADAIRDTLRKAGPGEKISTFLTHLPGGVFNRTMWTIQLSVTDVAAQWALRRLGIDVKARQWIEAFAAGALYGVRGGIIDMVGSGLIQGLLGRVQMIVRQEVYGFGIGGAYRGYRKAKIMKVTEERQKYIFASPRTLVADAFGLPWLASLEL